VALGFVEGLNNKIRVLQRRAYGPRDEEYLRLKILTCCRRRLSKGRALDVLYEFIAKRRYRCFGRIDSG